MPTESNVSNAEGKAAWDPNVGAGTPDTAPFEETAVSWLKRQPVLIFGLLLMIPGVTAAITSIASGETTQGVILAIVTAVVGAATRVVQQAVTPVAKPRLDPETPLTPDA